MIKLALPYCSKVTHLCFALIAYTSIFENYQGIFISKLRQTFIQKDVIFINEPMERPNHFAEQIENYLRENGVSLSVLAKQSKVSYSTLCRIRYCNGNRIQSKTAELLNEFFSSINEKAKEEGTSLDLRPLSEEQASIIRSTYDSYIRLNALEKESKKSK